MDESEWMFDVLYEISEAAETVGMKRLSCLLDICMDVYIEEEKLVTDASMMFRSTRAMDNRNQLKVWPFPREKPTTLGYPMRPIPPRWLSALEREVLSDVSVYRSK